MIYVKIHCKETSRLLRRQCRRPLKSLIVLKVLVSKFCHIRIRTENPRKIKSWILGYDPWYTILHLPSFYLVGTVERTTSALTWTFKFYSSHATLPGVRPCILLETVYFTNSKSRFPSPGVMRSHLQSFDIRVRKTKH